MILKDKIEEIICSQTPITLINKKYVLNMIIEQVEWALKTNGINCKGLYLDTLEFEPKEKYESIDRKKGESE